MLPAGADSSICPASLKLLPYLDPLRLRPPPSTPAELPLVPPSGTSAQHVRLNSCASDPFSAEAIPNAVLVLARLPARPLAYLLLQSTGIHPSEGALGDNPGDFQLHRQNLAGRPLRQMKRTHDIDLMIRVLLQRT